MLVRASTSTTARRLRWRGYGGASERWVTGYHKRRPALNKEVNHDATCCDLSQVHQCLSRNHARRFIGLKILV